MTDEVDVLAPAEAPAAPVEAPMESSMESPAEPVEAPTEAPAEDMPSDLSEGPQTTTEMVQVLVLEERPFMTTSFADYTVTEGLLLLVFLVLVADAFSNFLRRWF